MKTPSWNTLVSKSLAFATLLTALAPTHAKATTTFASEPLPVMLVATDDPSRYPDPICSKCTIIVEEDEESAGSAAGMRITYPNDAPGFAGEIAVTLLLESGERRTLWLSSVRLDPGTEVELVAEAEADWSWDQVRFVWLRFLAE